MSGGDCATVTKRSTRLPDMTSEIHFPVIAECTLLIRRIVSVGTTLHIGHARSATSDHAVTWTKDARYSSTGGFSLLLELCTL